MGEWSSEELSFKEVFMGGRTLEETIITLFKLMLYESLKISVSRNLYLYLKVKSENVKPIITFTCMW